ncbi:ATP-binding protein [Succinivibrio dextrinosolvens]|uniref:ATP-binding protein n=1 Tax=Succinivibrio dextrinosolvens TaxID=83771 RepID=UPI00241D5CC2|nr:DUF4143 domain-containing protein [Succinivibrio dextrinosolvens]MBE6424256.1 ATP-binding protein [Succinivibrio dextrinosolvens]
MADKYRKRLLDDIISKYLRIFGAVCIEGSKWCGKTCTSRKYSKSEIMLDCPDGAFQNRRLAEISSDIVLEGKTPRLIDEWQEVQPLWDAVRSEVDIRASKGQFILTGSSIPSVKNYIHSGAGRIAKLRMRPMSLFESGNSSGVISLNELCHGRIKPTLTGDVSLRSLTEFIIRGGWPDNQNTAINDAGILPAEYIRTSIEKDLYRIDEIPRNPQKVLCLLKSLARNESLTISNNALKNDIKNVDNENIDLRTITTYLDVLDRLYITENQEAFKSNVGSKVRVKNTVKRHFVDPSLSCTLLNLNSEQLIGNLTTFGFLFEALAERDLRIYSESFGGKLYHYQNYRNQKIDAVIELEDGNWCAFEIKLGANQIDSAAQNLIKIRNQIEKEDGRPPKIMCVICGLSNAAYKREDGVFVVPLTALRN